jgi:hypothetical protein
LTEHAALGTGENIASMITESPSVWAPRERVLALERLHSSTQLSDRETLLATRQGRLTRSALRLGRLADLREVNAIDGQGAASAERLPERGLNVHDVVAPGNR